MKPKSIQLHLAIFACGLALFLALIAIPQWVSSPSNIQKIILSPLFWPYAIAGMAGFIGVLMFWELRRTADDDEADVEIYDDQSAARIRLIAMAAIMIATMVLLPILGMVWTSMLAFFATAFLVKTRHPLAAIICAIVIPLALYTFFVHLAGVAIPQGYFVRLP